MAIANKLDGITRDERLLEAAAQLATARQALSEFEQAIVDFTFAAEVAARLGNAEAQIDALCGAALASAYLKRTPEMRRRAQQAMAVAEAAGASSAKADGILGYERIFAGDLAAARIYLERARPALVQGHAISQAAFATVSLAFLYDLRSEYAKAEGLFAEVMGGCTLLANPADLLRITWMRSMALANQGRISDALQTLNEAMRLCESNGEQYWISRIPNTVGWIYSELLDLETALNTTWMVLAGQQAHTPEVEANSHINLSNAYIGLGDLNLAWHHLSEGQRILNQGGDWLKWRFTIRLELENANYWLARRDLVKARASTDLALAKADSVLARKHMVRAHKIRADIDLLEDNPARAAAECRIARQILRHYPCRLIEWKVLFAASQAARLCGDSDHAESSLNHAMESLRF